MKWTGSGHNAYVTTSVVFPLTLAASDKRPLLIIRDLSTNEARVFLAA